MSYLVESNLLGVREFSIKDASLLASWMSTSAMDLFMISSSLTFPVQAETLIDYSKKIKPNEHNLYSVFLKETGQHIGHFEIKNINARHKIGTAAHIVLSPEYRRKGLGYHLINLISMVGFEVLGLYRISLSVHTVNVSAIAAYVKYWNLRVNDIPCIK